MMSERAALSENDLSRSLTHVFSEAFRLRQHIDHEHLEELERLPSHLEFHLSGCLRQKQQRENECGHGSLLYCRFGTYFTSVRTGTYPSK